MKCVKTSKQILSNVKSHNTLQGVLLRYSFLLGLPSALQDNCQAVKDYLDTVLGPYIVNVTEAASMCSRSLCSSRGRCQRLDSGSSAYLHLDPAVWNIIHRADLPVGSTGGTSYVIQKKLKGDKSESSGFIEMFKCQCFPGWQGEHCQKPVSR